VDVLIIGGTGTISRAIVQTLLRDGHAVTLYNRGLRSDPPPSTVRVIHGDRRERAAFAGLLGNPSACGKIINLTNPQPTTWVEWHQAAANALGTTATLVWMDRNNRIENADLDTLEDRIIAALRDIPTQLALTK
jgi:nucleoside-diphosphate-sugar epimerase